MVDAKRTHKLCQLVGGCGMGALSACWWVWHGCSVSLLVGVAWVLCQLVGGCGMGELCQLSHTDTVAVMLFDYLQALTSRRRRWMLGRRDSSFRSGIQLGRRDTTPSGRGSTEEQRCVCICVIGVGDVF